MSIKVMEELAVLKARNQELRGCLERIKECSGNQCAWLYETPNSPFNTCKGRGLSPEDTCPFCLAEEVLGKDNSALTH